MQIMQGFLLDNDCRARDMIGRGEIDPEEKGIITNDSSIFPHSGLDSRMLFR